MGQLTFDQIAQLLPALACSSGLLAVLAGEPQGAQDGRTAAELLGESQRRYPSMNVPADLAEGDMVIVIHH